MNDRDFELKLADYVAGEMDPGEASAFEMLLTGDPARRQLVQELRDADSALRAAVPDQNLAQLRTRELSSPRSRHRAAALSTWRPAMMLMRYAAVILVAFTCGFLARSWQPGAMDTPVVAGRETSYEMQFAQRYVQVSQTHPAASSFGRTLLAIARR